MPIDPKEALEYIGFTDAESLEDFKTKFHEKYATDEKVIHDKYVKPSIGKLMGKVKQNMLNKAREEGIEFTNSEFDDKEIEDIHMTIAERKAKRYMTELEELRSKGGDELVKTWQEKAEKASKRATEEETLRKSLAAEFDTFKQSASSQVKSVKVGYLKNDLMGKIKLKPGLKDLEKEGFNSYVDKTYRFDFDDQDRPIVLDASGSRIRSEKKADEWKSPEEVLTEAAKKFEIFADNPQSGKPVGGQFNPSQQKTTQIGMPPVNPNQKRKINPMFDKMM
jgi:hypothetical protein